MTRLPPTPQPSDDAAVAPWVLVNGTRHPLPPSGSLGELLSSLGIALDTPAVAVALNGQVVPRVQWAASRVAPGDVVEIVRPIQGGE